MSSFRVPGLERDRRGRVRVAKDVIKEELAKPGGADGGRLPSWQSMVTGRLVGKYDLSSAHTESRQRTLAPCGHTIVALWVAARARVCVSGGRRARVP